MGCLDSIVVLDLTGRQPGAFSAMFLGDFGAEVIKIDPPAQAVDQPAGGAERATGEEVQLAAYLSLDRGKRSVVLDLQRDAGRAVFLRLVERADVLVEGFRPGVMDGLGVGYARLAEANPRLVYCALTGFGPDGPYAGIPAQDINYLGIAGALSLIGPRGGPPCAPPNIVADYAGAGTHAVAGILIALMARQRTGRGQFVDIAHLDTVISLMLNSTFDYFVSGQAPKRGETMLTGRSPWGQIHRCKDGEYLATGSGERYLWINLCHAIGREDLIPYRDPSDPARAAYAIAELRKTFAVRTRDEWWEHLKDKDAAVTPVYNVDEVFRDPHVLHREMLVELDHPTLGKVRQTGIPIKLTDTPGEIRFPGVSTGADTTALLHDLGYDDSAIAELNEQGALG